MGDEVFILKAGDALLAPRDIPHQLRNSGNFENHYLLMFSPRLRGIFDGDDDYCVWQCSR